MSSKVINPCTRCGKERIEGKKWKEEVATFFGTSTIIHTDTVCPDKECQKIVEEKLEALKQKSDELKQEKQKKLDIATAARKAKALQNLKN
ncbi:MAG: hypothetical protein Q7T54_06135 [Candidatus Levybacteria bacterium]|nr:hypothetical protein [Candidatus Levybacteria bacterium]